ncbi:MAG TPA: hypothetical protein VD886_02675, partial [Herpetosiphonaceae bacterium]|nr:hypothetical protein [Herpetosiphonaceae bacterium]
MHRRMWLCVVLLGIGLLALSQSARAREGRQPASLTPQTTTLDAAALAGGANARTRVTPDGIAADAGGAVYTTAPRQAARF